MEYTNELIHESSPYLLQHAHNPVNWSAWNVNTWKRAETENKLVVVSIGYSTCHWCHVMEHECFEDTEVAAVMNKFFVNIKVDREERPDIDQIYMDTAQLIGGSGGWPLNVICLPDGRPVYAGTYFPKPNWLQVLLYFENQFEHNFTAMLEQAGNLTNSISLLEAVLPAKTQGVTQQDIDTAVQNILRNQDAEFGGNIGAPKFPMPINYLFLLQQNSNKSALQAVTTTLDKMLLGGIYDQVGGGFARYSTDAHWIIPHFEKMLYDNAQLVSLYAQAFQLTRDESYERIVHETLSFVERELSGENGNFYTALDADSEREEGKFYVWKYDELKQILKDEFADFCKVYQVSEIGNFEEFNHLQRKQKAVVDHEQETQWKQTLLQARSERIRPNLDNKSITAWNALMLKAYLDAYLATGKPQYLKTALKNGNFILKQQLSPQHFLYRNFKDGKSSIQAFLDDYAFTIEAFVMLYEITFDDSWLRVSQQLVQYCFENFFDKDHAVFYYTDKTGEQLIVRKKETSDNVIPASNSAMAKSLFKLGLLLENDFYMATAHKMVMRYKDEIIAHTSYYANWAVLMQWTVEEPYIIVITGNKAAELKKELGKHYLPNCFFAGGESTLIPSLKDKEKTDESRIYACRNRSCKLPTQSVQEALQQIQF